MSDPITQHRIPRMYLRGFTDSGEDGGHIDVYDLARKIVRKAQSLRSVEVENHFYTAENPTGDRFLAERGLSDIEGKVSPIIRTMEQSREMPTGNDRSVLMLFLALLMTRTAFFRHRTSEFIQQVLKDVLLLSFTTKEGWEQFLHIVEETGAKTSEVDKEQILTAIKEDRFTMDLEKPWHVAMMFKLAVDLEKALDARRWQLICQVDPSGPRFVTTDKPVTLIWADGGHGPLPPGFGMKRTVCQIPLTKSLFLTGWWPDEYKNFWPTWRPTIPLEVGRLNALVMSCAYHAVFASPEPFAWTKGDDPKLLQNLDLKEYLLSLKNTKAPGETQQEKPKAPDKHDAQEGGEV